MDIRSMNLEEMEALAISLGEKAGVEKRRYGKVFICTGR